MTLLSLFNSHEKEKEFSFQQIHKCCLNHDFVLPLFLKCVLSYINSRVMFGKGRKKGI